MQCIECVYIFKYLYACIYMDCMYVCMYVCVYVYKRLSLMQTSAPLRVHAPCNSLGVSLA